MKDINACQKLLCEISAIEVCQGELKTIKVIQDAAEGHHGISSAACSDSLRFM
jgi:hypothetical protein